MDFADVYRHEFASIALVAGTTAGDRAAGEDIAQEAFSRAHARWDEVGLLDRPGAWTRRVAINLALDRRRRLGSEARALLRIGSRRNTTPTAIRARATPRSGLQSIACRPANAQSSRCTITTA